MDLGNSADIKQQSGGTTHDVEIETLLSISNMKQAGLRIVIDDIVDDKIIEYPSIKNVKDPVEYISTMVEKIKSLARKRKVNGNLWEYNTCHSCRGLLDNKLLVHCDDEECMRYFCLRCMNKKYNTSPQEIYDIAKSDKWTCYSCKGFCNCKICKDRFLERGLNFFPNQLLQFEKSKRKNQKITAAPKSVNKDELSVRLTERSCSSPNIEIIPNKELEEEILISTATQINEVPTKSEKTKKLLPITIEAKIEVKPQANKMNRRSKLRSKVLAKNKLQENKMFPENSIDNDEAEDLKEREECAEIGVEVVENNIKNILKKGQKVGLKKRVKGECHFCLNILPDNVMAVCSVTKCKKGFCKTCIQENFQKDFSFKNYNPDYWICYSCGGVCRCEKCCRRRTTGIKPEKEDLLQTREERKAFGRPVLKRRPKYYDPITEADETNNFIYKVSKMNHREEEDSEQHSEVNSDNEEVEDSKIDANPFNKIINRRKRLCKPILLTKMDIDNSKIISEIDIDSACFTLYEAENEDELKVKLHKKF